MKKIIGILLILFSFTSCNRVNPTLEKAVKEKICQGLYERTGHKFWFIYGFDYDGSLGTNIKYKAFLYSDYLESLNYPGGVQVNLTRLEVDDYTIYQLSEQYEGIIGQVEVDALGLEKAKELFGERVNILNEGGLSEHMYQTIVVKKGQHLEYEEKVGFYLSHINVFVEDLEKIDHEKFKKKTFELGKYIFEELNYRTSLAVYVRDNSYFEDFNLVYNSIYRPFLGKEEVKIILEKLKKKEKITEKERDILIKNFYTDLDYEVCHLKVFFIDFAYDTGKKTLTLKDAIYKSEKKNGEYIYDRFIREVE